MTPQQPVKHAREDPIQPQVIHVTDAPDSLKDSTHIGAHDVYHLMKNKLSLINFIIPTIFCNTISYKV